MDKVLKTTCESFIANRDMLRENFRNEGSAMHLMGAAILSSIEDGPDAKELKECEKILKKHEGFFSPFRGALKFPVIINMSRKEDPVDYLRLVREAYDMICISMRSRNERYYLPAMEIAAEASSEEDISDLVEERESSFDEAAEFSTLLAELKMDEKKATSEVRDAEEFLGTQKGFGVMGVGPELKHMYAEMLVCIAGGKGEEAGRLAARHALDDALQSRFKA